MRRVVLLITVIAVLSGASAAAAKSVTVMTRNLYLGGDITRPIAAVAGKQGAEALVAFANANAATRAIVDQTNFPARAKLLAAEIATAKPDLVGLQEVTTWRSGEVELTNVGVANAKHVDYDFLKLLQSALRARGARYEVVRAQQESDVEGPAFEGSDASSGSDVRLTLRDVILRRKSSRVRITHAASRQYKTRIEISISGVTFAFIRGAVWADAKVGKKRFRFITTHLESQGAAPALAQAEELMKGPAAVRGKPVVLVCDCNSDPDEATTEDGNQSAYQALTGQSPYAGIGTRPLFDTWTTAHPSRPGFTSGFSELVNDPDTSGLHHRIDLVLGRTAAGRPLKVRKARITGLTKKTPGGLWASDHAGLVARLRL
jgi:endonuclease/exonuclease/phosphatase family metal-dependent hydrolase